MTEKEAIGLIRAYSGSKRVIESIHKEIEEYKRDIESMRQLTAVRYDGMPHGTATSDPTAKAAAEIVDLYDKRIAELRERVQVILDNNRRVEDMLSVLSRDERRVITARYIDGIRWDFIPGRVHISRMQCFRLKNKAMKKMCAISKDDTK